MTKALPTTPCYVIDCDALRRNLEILRGVMNRTGAKILLAQKAFSCYGVYPLIAEYLAGATASGLYEAKLWHEEISSKPEWQARGIENHVYNPAFQEKDIEEIFSICDHIVFNSPAQLLKYGARAKAAGLQVGLRINPEFSTQTDHAIYDPCAPGSRLGTTLAEFEEMLTSQQSDTQHSALSTQHSALCTQHSALITQHSALSTLHSALSTQHSALCTQHSALALWACTLHLDGLHFHTLCEQDSDDLEATWNAFEEKFGRYLSGMKWINFGGGHHITREGYDIERLERLITRVRDKYKVQVYLEPGEAIALNAGYLYTTVLEVRPTLHSALSTQHSALSTQHSALCTLHSALSTQHSALSTQHSALCTLHLDGVAILDASAACHMPDVIEMPYTPPLEGARIVSQNNTGTFTPLVEGTGEVYRLGGPTCLAGDIIGDYRFDHALREGEILRFNDMAIYSMVKNNTFNGMPLPAIYLKEGDSYKLWKEFGYQDFKCRL